MLAFLKQQAKHLFPGYFALVMAIGALSIGTNLLGLIIISELLLYISEAIGVPFLKTIPQQLLHGLQEWEDWSIACICQ